MKCRIGSALPPARALVALFLGSLPAPACCPAGKHRPGDRESVLPVVNADQTVIIIWDAKKKTQHFIRKAHNGRTWVSPRVVIGIPSEITQVERRAVEDSAYRAKASEVYLVEEAMAAAIGAGLPITEPHGNIVVDIGGGTTDIAVFKQGAIRHTAVVPIAGDQITNDVAVAFRTPTQSAEEIKIKHGCALRQLADPREVVEVPGESALEVVFHDRAQRLAHVFGIERHEAALFPGQRIVKA